jgi:hypothetical protein
VQKEVQKEANEEVWEVVLFFWVLETSLLSQWIEVEFEVVVVALM